MHGARGMITSLDNKPCFRAFHRTAVFPRMLLGPVERKAFRRLALIFFDDVGFAADSGWVPICSSWLLARIVPFPVSGPSLVTALFQSGHTPERGATKLS